MKGLFRQFQIGIGQDRNLILTAITAMGKKQNSSRRHREVNQMISGPTNGGKWWSRSEAKSKKNRPISDGAAMIHVACKALIQFWASSLNACIQSLRRKPGMHQRMHRGSIARAASAGPMSAVSQPN